MTVETLTIEPGAGPPVAGAGLDLLAITRDVVDLSALLTVAGRRTPDVEIGGAHGMLRVPRKRYDRVELPLVLWLRGLDDNGRIPAGSTAAAEFYKHVRAVTAVLAADVVTLAHGLPDGSVRWIAGEVLAALDPTRRNPGTLGQLAFKLSCAYPFWCDAGDPLVATTTSTGSTTWQVDEFDGMTAPVEDLVIRFECTAGTVPNPSLAQGDVSLTYEDTFGVGDYVEVDCGTWAVTAGGALTADLSKVAKTGGEARLFVLAPPGTPTGPPTVQVAHTGTGTLAVTLTGRRRHLVG